VPPPLPAADAPARRLQACTALAWALLLGGWLGLGSLAQFLAPGPAIAFALMGAWLALMGAAATLLERRRLPMQALRILSPCTAGLAGAALMAASHGGGLAALAVASAAWAAAVALAFAAVRDGRASARQGRPAAPMPGAAALGALAAWACAGDIGDVGALAARLGWAMPVAGMLLALLWTRGSASPALAPGKATFRAGMRQCGPLAVGSAAMLPMMAGLPLMASLCRAEAIPPQWMLGLHFAAMFVPALCLALRPALAARAPGACAALLAAGALWLFLAPGALAWEGLALAHGTAWSLGRFACPSPDPQDMSSRRQAPWVGALRDGCIVTLLGAGVAFAGLDAMAWVHVALGLLGPLAWVFSKAAQPHRDAKPQHGPPAPAAPPLHRSASGRP